MPNSVLCGYPKIDKNDQSDLTNFTMCQYNLVFSTRGS